MARFIRWIGGGVGWALGGPIGGILGFALGAMFESMSKGTYAHDTDVQDAPRRVRTQPGDFQVSLIILTAAVMKADGKQLKSELDYVKTFLRSNFRISEAEEMLALLKQVLTQELNVPAVTNQIRYYMDYPARLQLMHFLFGLALADGEVHPSELNILTQIGQGLGIKNSDFDSIKAMFVPDTDSAYKVLEIDPSASDEEVRKAYRRMAAKYHPDKVGHLGEEVQDAAKRKFQDLQSAYEKVKKQRGMV